MWPSSSQMKPEPFPSGTCTMAISKPDFSTVHICRLRMFTWQNSSKTKELSLNSMRLFIEVGPLRFSISFFAYNISNFFPIVVHAKKHLLECQNEVNPQWININCSLLKRPHHFQACTGKLIEERRCHMQNNELQTKSYVEFEDNSLIKRTKSVTQEQCGTMWRITLPNKNQNCQDTKRSGWRITSTEPVMLTCGRKDTSKMLTTE